jgi:hypothetical protein
VDHLTQPTVEGR